LVKAGSAIIPVILDDSDIAILPSRLTLLAAMGDD
jgi:hypothetical protein